MFLKSSYGHVFTVLVIKFRTAGNINFSLCVWKFSSIAIKNDVTRKFQSSFIFLEDKKCFNSHLKWRYQKIPWKLYLAWIIKIYLNIFKEKCNIIWFTHPSFIDFQSSHRLPVDRLESIDPFQTSISL